MFEGKSVFITGAASGLGRATAVHLGSLGARVVAGDVDEEQGRATVSTVTAAGGTAAIHDS